jgi:hypothetical protein
MLASPQKGFPVVVSEGERSEASILLEVMKTWRAGVATPRMPSHDGTAAQTLLQTMQPGRNGPLLHAQLVLDLGL